MTVDDDYSRAMSDIVEAHARAVAAVSAMPGTEALAHATRMREEVEELADAIADLRAEIAARIADDEKLSLAGLADRIGVSKSRADQMVRRAKGRGVSSG